MPKPMPKKMEEMLDKLDSPEEVRYFQGKWNEYVAANENYERAYPEQFANLVDGNRRFGQNKTIDTPAEQMRGLENLLETELSERVAEKEAGREEVYEIEAQDHGREDMPQEKLNEKMQDFKLTFDTMDEKEVEKQQAKEMDIPQQPYEYSLNFGNLDEPGKEDWDREPEAPGMDEREDD